MPGTIVTTFRRPEDAPPVVDPAERWQPAAAMRIPYGKSALDKFALRILVRTDQFADAIEPDPHYGADLV